MLLLYILFVLIGVGLGIITGLMPGLHVNNVAAIILYIYASFHTDPLLLANLIVANMITHTFVDFIPSTFFGAPNEDTSLSVLPMHRLLLQGDGFKAIYISTYGSLLATIFALPLIPLFQIALVNMNLAKYLYFYTPLLLLLIILGLLYMESKKNLKSMLLSILVIAISGTFGYIALHFPLNHNYVIFGNGMSILFPIFTGLFGIPVLLLSQNTIVPKQRIVKPKIERKHYISSLVGTLSGSLVGFLPGVTSGVAAAISRIFIKEDDTEDFLYALGSVNTANYIFNLTALFLILRPRSAAVNIISQMLNIPVWFNTKFPPSSFLLILLTVAIASLLSFFITIFLGKWFAKGIGKIGKRYGLISRILIFILFAIIFIFTGIIGVALGIIATLIGLLPPKLGIMRVHLMSVIIIPVLIAYL